MRLKENSLALLASATVDLQDTDPKTTVYTIPAGMKAIVTLVVIREPTASLNGGTDFDVGAGVNADDWKQTVNLTLVIGVDDYYVITNDNTMITQVYVAGETFGIKPATGATLDAQATMDVFGYLVPV